ncbi:MAG: hypothetical protein DWQ36_02615 [Acidobacteria bacterium]|nr:MAG: hypothetical protein DWQ30_24005 [Acidobacteriota bacterium]REK11330.1 MAG: hypothetical protein DWQ36_02615 [Acidobacteriota bacterium]
MLVGASNLTLLLPHLVRRAPVARLAVRAGHGRALTCRSRFLVRALPPSAPSPGADEAAPALPWALDRLLVMDLGLDVLYGASVQAVVEALERLIASAGEPPTMLIRPPVASVQRLDGVRFGLLRRLFFPGRAMPREVLIERLSQLDEALLDLAGRRSCQLSQWPERWVSADAIHLRLAARGEATQWLLERLAAGSAAGSAEEPPVPEGRPGGAFVRLRAWPERCSIGPLRLSRRQPCVETPEFELWVQ